MLGIKLYRDLWIDYRTRYSRYILPFISYYLFSVNLFISAITTQWNWSLAKANCPNTNCAHARITTVEIEILLTPASTIIWIAFTLIYASDDVTIVDGLSFLHFLCYTLYFLYPEIKFEIPTWNFDIFHLLSRSSVYACTRFLLLHKLCNDVVTFRYISFDFTNILGDSVTKTRIWRSLIFTKTDLAPKPI